MKRPSNQLRFIEAQQWASSFLESNSKDPAIAYHLLLGMMDWDVTTWYRKQQDQMDLVTMRNYQEMLKKIVDEDMPYQYLLGEAWFYGYRFHVNEATLIPRFDTERLIDCVHSLRETRQLVKQADVLDLGTGSGAIAVTLAKEFPDLNLTAVDISSDALAVAKENAYFHQVTIEWIKGDMLDAVAQRKFDLIISNPPYISENEIDEMGADVLKYEPKLALFAKDDGYYYYKQFARHIQSFMKADGILLMECGSHQAAKIISLFKKSNPKAEVKSIKDYNGIDRIIYVQWKKDK